MPIKLIAPKQGRTPYWHARGKHLGCRVNRSTKARTAALARKVVRQWERQIERGVFAEPDAPTFASAALGYMQAGGDRRFVDPLLVHFRTTPLIAIDQAAIDQAAIAVLPNATPATRNRQVYSPVSAIMKHGGADWKIRRPKGSRGRQIAHWLRPPHAFAIVDEAYKLDAEFGLLLDYLLYTGERLSAALHLTCDHVNLAEQSAFVPKTKNGDPRTVFLPDHLVVAMANHPRGLDRKAARVFRFHKNSALYYLLDAARQKASGLPKPKRIKKGLRVPRAERPSFRFDFVTFHTFCHTWATWMRRYGGLDALGLIETGRWRHRQSVDRYTHGVVGEAARKAALLPTPPTRPAHGKDSA